jgi:hypothetical protein
MSGILDYISQQYNQASNYVGDKYKQVTGSVTTAKRDVGDVLSKAVNPPRTAWIDQSQRNANFNKYNVKSHSYPSDLLEPQYGGNYAIFYVNVSDAGRLRLQDEVVDMSNSTEARMRGSLVGNAKALTDQLEQGLAGWNKIAPDAANINIDAVKNAVPFNGRSQRRLKTAIALHIPNQLSVNYKTNWDTTDTANAQALMAAGSSGINAVGEAFAGNKEAAKKNLSDALGTGAEAAVANKFLGKDSKYGGLISAATGTAANPKKEQTFQGVDFRSFTFDYQFYPRDEFEAQNILNIIYEFKYHMHPEFKSELNYVWIYPSEFDIIYYTGGQENKNLHKHTSCILESMSVNYTPNGNFSVFANGMPTQINISLSFRELQLASKETIGQSVGGGL